MIRQRIAVIGVFSIVWMALPAHNRPAKAAPCCADCNNDAQVTINELIRGVNEALTGDCTPRPSGGGGLLQTGQTTCYDTRGAAIPCAGTGQDGEFQEGAPFSYTDNGDGTVSDAVTGLVWERLSDDGSIHDKDNQYTWSDAGGVKIATLNSVRFAGRSDWRLPNMRELESLLNYGNVAPGVSPMFNSACTAGCSVATCSCTASTFHWSSTTYRYAPDFAWGINFVNGNTNSGPKANGYSVRAVRGGS